LLAFACFCLLLLAFAPFKLIVPPFTLTSLRPPMRPLNGNAAPLDEGAPPRRRRPLTTALPHKGYPPPDKDATPRRQRLPLPDEDAPLRRRSLMKTLPLDNATPWGGVIGSRRAASSRGVAQLGRAAARGRSHLNDDCLRTCLVNTAHIRGAGGQEALENERQRRRGDDDKQRNGNQRQDNYRQRDNQRQDDNEMKLLRQ
jgi:hypothetical protein